MGLLASLSVGLQVLSLEVAKNREFQQKTSSVPVC